MTDAVEDVTPGDKLRKLLLTERNQTMEATARDLDVSLSYISLLLRNERDITYGFLGRVFATYGAETAERVVEVMRNGHPQP